MDQVTAKEGVIMKSAKQTWRERLSIIGKMVNAAFNGDARKSRDVVKFTLVVVSPDRYVSIARNMSNAQSIVALRATISMMEDEAANDDDEIVGHA